MTTKNGANKRHYPNEQRRLGSSQAQSREAGDEPHQTFDSDSAGENNYRKIILGRRDITGGIISQLIQESEDQLAELDRQGVSIAKQRAKTEKRLEAYLKLQASLSAEEDIESNN